WACLVLSDWFLGLAPQALCGRPLRGFHAALDSHFPQNPASSLGFIIRINVQSLLPDGYFLRMVRESRLDDLVQLLDYRFSLLHERGDTRVLIDLNAGFAR